MKHRLELFSYAVMAIVITIMVLDLHTPATGGWHAFVPILPAIGIYSIGFSMIGLCWLTHHRYFAKMETFNRKMVWSNFFFLFVVSLLPLPRNPARARERPRGSARPWLSPSRDRDSS